MVSSSSFGGIQQAANALAAARYGLEVVSQNIANATTPGYTRQASQQAAVGGTAGVPGLYTRPSGFGGVTVVGTARLNDPVLDARARTEHSRGAAADAATKVYTDLENVFPEPSDNGLSEQLNDFWNSWAPVANDPGAEAPRRVLLQRAATVVSTLNAMSTSLDTVAATSSQSLGNDIAAADTAAKQLAQINGQLIVAHATGANANSLLDQRDQLLDQLSKLVGGVASFNADGSANVTVGGQALVSGVTANGISVDASYQVRVNSTPVTLGAGSASADVAALTTTIPKYQSMLDAVAQKLASTVNAQQAAGQDLAGNPGAAMFAGGPPLTAASISIALSNPDGVAAAGAGKGTLDGGNALVAGTLGGQPGSADALYGGLVGDLASASALSQQQQATQASVTAHVDTLRDSVSGVSIDEEVSNMLTYQRTFQAASRVLTTVDDMLDTLINRTGLVGR